MTSPARKERPERHGDRTGGGRPQTGFAGGSRLFAAIKRQQRVGDLVYGVFFIAAAGIGAWQ